MIGRRFAGRVAGEIDVGTVVHACHTARDDDAPSSLILSLPSIGQVKITGGSKQLDQCYRQEVVCGYVYTESIVPVRVPRRPEGRLQLIQ